MGGFCIGYEGSGALLCVCGAPAMVAESSGVTELHQAVLCTNSSVCLHLTSHIPPAEAASTLANGCCKPAANGVN